MIIIFFAIANLIAIYGLFFAAKYVFSAWFGAKPRTKR